MRLGTAALLCGKPRAVAAAPRRSVSLFSFLSAAIRAGSASGAATRVSALAAPVRMLSLAVGERGDQRLERLRLRRAVQGRATGMGERRDRRRTHLQVGIVQRGDEGLDRRRRGDLAEAGRRLQARLRIGVFIFDRLDQRRFAGGRGDQGDRADRDTLHGGRIRLQGVDQGLHGARISDLAQRLRRAAARALVVFELRGVLGIFLREDRQQLRHRDVRSALFQEAGAAQHIAAGAARSGVRLSSSRPGHRPPLFSGRCRPDRSAHAPRPCAHWRRRRPRRRSARTGCLQRCSPSSSRPPPPPRALSCRCLSAD